MAAKPHLAALADEELDPVGEHQVMGVEPVARLDALVEPLGGIAPLVGDHAAFARTRRGPRHGGATGERGFCFVGQCAETHAGDIDRNVQIERPGGAGADNRPGFAFFAITLDDKPGQGSGHEGQIVPVGDFLEQRHAAHAVAAQLGFDVNVVDHMGRENKGISQPVGIAVERFFDGFVHGWFPRG